MSTPQTPEANRTDELVRGAFLGFCSVSFAMGAAAFGGRTAELVTDGISNHPLEWGIYGGGTAAFLLGAAACGWVAFRSFMGRPVGKQQ
jgi:hypothetical protein